MTLLKIYPYILRSVIIVFATLYIALPPPVRTGASRSMWTAESNVVPESHRGTLFSVGCLEGVRRLSGGVFARMTRWVTRFR